MITNSTCLHNPQSLKNLSHFSTAFKSQYGYFDRFVE